MQLAQAVHAAFQIATAFPSRVSQWHRDSNYLVVLSSPDVNNTVPTVQSAGNINTGWVFVTEPDLPGDPVTAVAYLPAPHVGRALSSLPLALKERAMT